MTNHESNSSNIVLEYELAGAEVSNSAICGESGWKGLADLDCQPVDVGGKEVTRDQVDMTSMVDVTFLLLIFFMVTASFAISKSMEMPFANAEGASVQPTSDCQQLTVFVDRDNTFLVSSPVEDIECPSEREMWTRVREAVSSKSVDRMIVKAHVDSLHQKAVAAWDAGRFAGVSDIMFETSVEEL